MSEKKQAINISLILVLINLALAYVCWLLQNCYPFMSFLFSVFSGILGSGLAALWIFVAEYRREKKRLLEDIFREINHIRVNLPYFHQYEQNMDLLRRYMDTQYYQEPQPKSIVCQMNALEKTTDSLCRFVDKMLDLDYNTIDQAIKKVYEVDFWWPSKKHQETIRQRLGYSLYSAIMSKPAEEEDYVFRYFRNFRDDKSYTAGDILEIVMDLHHAFHVECDCGKPNKASDSLNGQLYESLWIFRNAFFMPQPTRKERKEAMSAFLYDTPYYRIR